MWDNTYLAGKIPPTLANPTLSIFTSRTLNSPLIRIIRERQYRETQENKTRVHREAAITSQPLAPNRSDSRVFSPYLSVFSRNLTGVPVEWYLGR